MSRNDSEAGLATAIVVSVLILFVVLNVVSYVWFPFLPWTEQREAGQDIVEQEMSGQNALNDYREFRRLYNDIEAQRNKIDNSYDELERFYDIQGKNPDNWSRQAEVRHGRIQERITGNQQQLENLVAEYNAMADDPTRSIWQCGLPYNVDDRFAIQGPPGSDGPEEPRDVGPNGNKIEGEPLPAEECNGLPEEARAQADS